MKHRKFKRILILVIILSLFAGILSACSAPAANTSGQTTKAALSTTAANLSPTASGLKPLNFGYPISGVDFMGGIAGIAQVQGYLDEELSNAGYKANYQGFAGAGPAVNEALASGKLDVALYADFPGIVLQSKGVNTKLLSIVTQSYNAGIVVTKDSPIKTMSDLKGKKIAFPKGTYVQKYLYQALEKYGLKQSDVELINMTTDAESALMSGAIDAVAYTDTLISKIAYGPAAGRIINTTRENKDWTGAIVLIARGDYIGQNRTAGVAIIKAMIRAKAFAKANPEAVYKIFAEKGKDSLESAKFQNNLDDGKFDYYTLDVGKAGLDKLNANKQFLTESKLIQKDFDVYTWGDNSYYEEALKP